MLLIKSAEVYNPKYIGKKDIFIGGGKILGIADDYSLSSLNDLHIIDANGFYVFPGLIDGHIHIAGAGGEGGPATRTPEVKLSELFSAGITTVVGCLGTDGITRNVDSVLMKAKSLKENGLSAFMYTGAYQVPPPTITGDITTDILYIEEVIGVGEIAISDHRSSFPSADELVKLAQHARVAGMLSNKSGIINLHMGDAKNPFKPIEDAVHHTGISFKQFLPTHCNRNDYIFDDAKGYGVKGYIDLTASSYPYYPDIEVKPSRAIRELMDAGVPPGHITLTSDANGSLPDFDDEGNLKKLVKGSPISIWSEIRDAINEGVPMDQAISVSTLNIARILKLHQKGLIETGMDADLLIINKELDIHGVVALGKLQWYRGEMQQKVHFEE